jgi:4a-hydroxytetrahydrobiopterin dehydratase
VSELKNRSVLDAGQVTELLLRLPGWVVVEGALERVFQFESYLEGIEFVKSLALKAEELDHHPDLFIGWRKVRVRLTTHSPRGITQLDETLAKAAEDLFGA